MCQVATTSGSRGPAIEITASSVVTKCGIEGARSTLLGSKQAQFGGQTRPRLQEVGFIYLGTWVARAPAVAQLWGLKSGEQEQQGGLASPGTREDIARRDPLRSL